MKATGAAQVRYALEQVGVRHTFGIPGVHNTELYDELDSSALITPHLVTNEFNAGFAADAVSRTGGIGTLVIVPGAGLTHAASGIAEAYLDGIAMLVITGGVRAHGHYRYQLHDLDQAAIAAGFTKGAVRVTSQAEAVRAVYEAYDLATSGVPGPVLVELPVDVGMELGPVPTPAPYRGRPPLPLPPGIQLDKAAEILVNAQRPAMFVGWGARHARRQLVALAEAVDAPVATTLQGLAAFPHDHPLHAGFGFGPAAVPAARNALADHDALLAVGVRFAEIATGSYGIPEPRNLIHVDIDREVIGANYPVRIPLVGDSAAIVPALTQRVSELRRHTPRAPRSELRERIRADKAQYRAEFAAAGAAPRRINPARLFGAVQSQAPRDVIVTVDDGNHTFLTAELWQVTDGADLIGPSDFNAMGYAVPAAVGAKLAHPDREVMTFVGDGCFRMSGLELVTLAEAGLGAVIFVFNDGELSQISQAQQLPYQRSTCTVLPDLHLEGIAVATGSNYLTVDDANDLDETIAQARLLAAAGEPVVVDVRVDYARKSTFTASIVATNFGRFPLRDKARLGVRALSRRLANRAGQTNRPVQPNRPDKTQQD